MKKYSKEFKENTIQLIINENQKVKEVAEDLGINRTTLHAWVTAYKKEHNIALREVNSIVSQESESEELKHLRRENKILKQERDILKKATAYFAKETL